MALFGVFLFIIVTMTAEMRRNEKKWPVNFFAHPEVGSVLARMRRDIYDSTARPDNFETYSSSPTTLIVYTINNDGTAETVVWDFSEPGEVHRKAFKATLLSSEWMARGLPLFIGHDGADAVGAGRGAHSGGGQGEETCDRRDHRPAPARVSAATCSIAAIAHGDPLLRADGADADRLVARACARRSASVRKSSPRRWPKARRSCRRRRW